MPSLSFVHPGIPFPWNLLQCSSQIPDVFLIVRSTRNTKYRLVLTAWYASISDSIDYTLLKIFLNGFNTILYSQYPVICVSDNAILFDFVNTYTFCFLWIFPKRRYFLYSCMWICMRVCMCVCISICVSVYFSRSQK